MNVRDIFLLVLSVFAVLAADAATAAEQPSANDIVRALTPKTTPPGMPGIRSLRGVEVKAAEEPPKIDLYINFKYDSAELEPDALVILRTLGDALKSDALKRSRIEIIGHTDAKGDDAYNQRLSERRAQTVRALLVNAYQIDGTRLSAAGQGERALKDPAHPEDGINRRVEIRNTGTVP